VKGWDQRMGSKVERTRKETGWSRGWGMWKRASALLKMFWYTFSSYGQALDRQTDRVQWTMWPPIWRTA